MSDALFASFLYLFGLASAAPSTSPDANAEVQIQLRVRGGSTSDLAGTVTLNPSDQEGESVVLPVIGSSVLRARLPDQTLWKISAEIEGHWTSVEGGTISPGKCKAKLLPQIAAGGGDPAATSRLRNLETIAKVSETGFFQIEGVAPGTYVLEVTQEGLAPARVIPVEIWPDSETALRQSVVLRPPVTIEVSIAPALDLSEQPWNVAVLRASEYSASFDTAPVFDAEAGADGHVSIPGQAPGTFSVIVVDSEGNKVFFDHHVLVRDAADAVINIEIDYLALKGLLTFRDEPLAGLRKGG